MAKKTTKKEVEKTESTKENVAERIEKIGVKALNELVKEAAPSAIKKSRIGKIVEVRKGDNYDKDKQRLFLISYNGGYVFLKEEDSPEWLRKLKKLIDIVDKEILFKVKDVDNKSSRIYVSSQMINEYYEDVLKTGKILTGKIVGVKRPNSKNIDEDLLVIQCQNDYLYMPRTEYDIIYPSWDLSSCVGHKTNFKIIKIDDEKVYISHRAVDEPRFKEVLKELQSGALIEATIIKSSPKFAVLAYKGIPLTLRNKDFSTDYTKVSEVKNVNDVLLVKLKQVGDKDRIFVEMAEKYTRPYQTNLNIFEPKQICLGRVEGLTTYSAYVNIAPGVDVMCPFSEGKREPMRGDIVKVSLSKVDIENRRVKGYIIEYLNKEDFNEKVKSGKIKDIKDANIKKEDNQ